jgi:hypothetical protein
MISGCVPMLPLQACRQASGLMRRPCCLSGTRDEKSVGGDSAILIIKGVVVGFWQLVPTRTRLGVGSDRCQRAHSARCVAAMAWISASWQYNLSTPSAVGGAEVFKGLVTAASVWPPSRLVEGATLLAQVWVEAKSTIRILSTSFSCSCHDDSSGCAGVVACLPVSLLCHCVASCSTLGYRAWACTRCPS